jgi:hypothetical protein
MSIRKLITLSFLMLLLSIATIIPAYAADGVQVRLMPTRDSLTVGELVPLTLEVTHQADQHIIIPELDPTWGDFEVRTQSGALITSNPDGTATTVQQITVTAYETGSFETPPLSLQVTTGSAQVTELTVPPVHLEVASVLAEGGADLKDIRPQVVLAGVFPWPLVGLIGTALIIIAAAGVWLAKRWLGRGFVVDNRAPHQVALDELAAIEKRRLPEAGKFKEFYTLVTDSLRHYLECQFGIQATDFTTAELGRELVHTPLAPEHRRQLTNLSGEADFVKFARIIPDIDEADRFLQAVRRLVEATKPEASPIPADQKPQTIENNHVEVLQ